MTLSERLASRRVTLAEWESLCRAGRIIAGRAHRRQPPGYGALPEDLEQVAEIALWLALERFDAARGVKFSTFAWSYMSGYVLREALEWSHVPRSRLDDRSKRGGELSPWERVPVSWEVLRETLIDGPDALSAPDDCESEALWRVEWQQVRDSINDLPRSYRTPMEMHLSGLSQREIGQELGVSSQAINHRLQRATKLLRERLAE